MWKGSLTVTSWTALILLSPRSNLDPWGEHSDVQLWEALQAVQLSAAVSQLAGGLAARMDQGGDNLSVGVGGWWGEGGGGMEKQTHRSGVWGQGKPAWQRRGQTSGRGGDIPFGMSGGVWQ